MESQLSYSRKAKRIKMKVDYIVFVGLVIVAAVSFFLILDKMQ